LFLSQSTLTSNKRSNLWTNVYDIVLLWENKQNINKCSLIEHELGCIRKICFWKLISMDFVLKVNKCSFFILLIVLCWSRVHFITWDRISEDFWMNDLTFPFCVFFTNIIFTCFICQLEQHSFDKCLSLVKTVESLLTLICLDIRLEGIVKLFTPNNSKKPTNGINFSNVSLMLLRNN
jgi:hypothetical protein